MVRGGGRRAEDTVFLRAVKGLPQFSRHALDRPAGARRERSACSELRTEKQHHLTAGVLIILGILIAFFLSRSITQTGSLLTKAAAEIAKGNLGHEIRLRGRDELGMLARSFAQMKAALQGIAAMAERIAAGDLAGSFVPRSDADSLGIALKVMVENLQGQLREIQEGAAVVVTAASEISASTSQFAANSSETSVGGEPDHGHDRGGETDGAPLE